jgi:hypothetical protein
VDSPVLRQARAPKPLLHIQHESSHFVIGSVVVGFVDLSSVQQSLARGLSGSTSLKIPS